MKTTVIAVLFIIGILIPISCEDKALLVNCSECLNDRPSKGTLTIKISYNNENQTVPISIFAGNIEEGKLVFEGTGYNSYGNTSKIFYFDNADFGQYYSVVAKYKNIGRTIKVVDGKMLKIKLDNSSCDRSCYVIEGDEFDVRLK